MALRQKNPRTTSNLEDASESSGVAPLRQEPQLLGEKPELEFGFGRIPDAIEDSVRRGSRPRVQMSVFLCAV